MAWPLTGQHSGRTDTAMWRHGDEEACELERWLRNIFFTRALTSLALRARQTYGHPRIPVIAPWNAAPTGL
jgi:broad specificity phosphatase PhoE